MNVLVETAQGIACLCGDVLYHIQNQVVDPLHEILDSEPQTTGNHAMTKRSGEGGDQEGAELRLSCSRSTTFPPVSRAVAWWRASAARCPGRRRP